MGKQKEEKIIEEEVLEELDFDADQLDRSEWLEELEHDYHKNGKPLPGMDAW